MATAEEEALESGRGGLGVEESKGPVGTVSVGGEGHRRCFGVFAHHEGGMRGNRESAPGGQGGGEEGEEAGPGPP